MSDEPRKDEDSEVEAHSKRLANDEPKAEGETEDEVEAHIKKPSKRY